MEQIYSEEQNVCGIMKAKPETVAFLLNYSKTLQVTNYRNFTFEANLN